VGGSRQLSPADFIFKTKIMKPIPSYFGYFATKDGRIWSAPRKNSSGHLRKGRFLKPSLNKITGYFKVTLFKNGKPYYHFVHRLILKTFIGPCPDDMEACHNDGNPQNNNLENLRWDTRSNNTKDSMKHGTHHVNITPKLTEKDIRLIRKLYEYKEFNQPQLANKFNVSGPNISDIIRRKTWKHI